MSNTKEGGQKTKATIYERYGSEYFRNIGRSGGLKGSTGGFGSHKIGADGLSGRERARRAGKIGGKNSKRGIGSKYSYELVSSAMLDQLSGVAIFFYRKGEETYAKRQTIKEYDKYIEWKKDNK